MEPEKIPFKMSKSVLCGLFGATLNGSLYQERLVSTDLFLLSHFANLQQH